MKFDFNASKNICGILIIFEKHKNSNQTKKTLLYEFCCRTFSSESQNCFSLLRKSLNPNHKNTKQKFKKQNLKQNLKHKIQNVYFLPFTSSIHIRSNER